MTPQRYSCTNERGQPRIVLLVEDEPFVREATCCLLRSAGFEVLPTADAQEAMKVYEQSERKIDLLMSDVGLPGRNGYQLGQDVHSVSPEIPVLLTSGYGETGYETESLEAHTYYLAKPYSRAELIEKIEKVLGPAPLRRAAATRAC
jgi:DNA-binding response OmpR family regulator